MKIKRILFVKAISVFCLSMIFLFFSLSTIAQSDSKDKIVAIATGNKHCIALRSDGTVWTWGNNEHGQLGNGTTTKSNKPVQVKGLTNVIAVAGGENHSVALKKDGTVWAWGIKECLGNHINNDSTFPVQVKYVKKIISIGAGFSNSIAVQKDGTVWTWGDNMYLQLGKEDYDGYLPIQVQGLNNVRQAACGLGFCIVVRNDGTVWAWGWNKNTHFCVDASDINDETFANPRKVQKISNIKEVSGSSYILALKNNGLVLRWGDGGFPEVVKGVEGVKSISEGYSHSLAVKRDGTVWAWGLNDQGQLGDGNVVQKFFKPTQVKGLSNIISIAAGEGYSIAVESNGTVWAWGANDKGQLGDGTFTNKNKPVKVVFKS